MTYKSGVVHQILYYATPYFYYLYGYILIFIICMVTQRKQYLLDF